MTYALIALAVLAVLALLIFALFRSLPEVVKNPDGSCTYWIGDTCVTEWPDGTTHIEYYTMNGREEM